MRSAQTGTRQIAFCFLDMSAFAARSFAPDNGTASTLFAAGGMMRIAQAEIAAPWRKRPLGGQE
jgi:hypothetical protein